MNSISNAGNEFDIECWNWIRYRMLEMNSISNSGIEFDIEWWNWIRYRMLELNSISNAGIEFDIECWKWIRYRMLELNSISNAGIEFTVLFVTRGFAPSTCTGFSFYLRTVVCNFRPLFHSACRRSVDSVTLCDQPACLKWQTIFVRYNKHRIRGLYGIYAAILNISRTGRVALM